MLYCFDLALNEWHTGLAESIAPDGGPGSNIIVVRVQPLDNSWLQNGSSICKISIHMMSLPWSPSDAIFSANPGCM